MRAGQAPDAIQALKICINNAWATGWSWLKTERAEMTEQTLGWCWRARKASCMTNISRSVASMVLFSTSTHWTPRHIPGILWNCQVPDLSHGESSGHILHSFQFKHHPPEPRIKNEWIPELWRTATRAGPMPKYPGKYSCSWKATSGCIAPGP